MRAIIDSDCVLGALDVASLLSRSLYPIVRDSQWPPQAGIEWLEEHSVCPQAQVCKSNSFSQKKEQISETCNDRLSPDHYFRQRTDSEKQLGIEKEI